VWLLLLMQCSALTALLPCAAAFACWHVCPADDGKVMQQLDQLVAGLKLPAADTPTLRKGLSFLAALAWLTLPPGFDAAAAAGGSKKAGKKQKQKQAAPVGSVDAVLQQEEVQQGLQLAASIQPQPSSLLRQTAAARLVGLLHHLHNRAGALAAAAAHQKQPKDGKQQKAGQQEAVAAAHAAAAQSADTLTNELLALFAAAQKLPSVAVTADEDIAEMVEQLGQLSDAVEQHVPSAAPAAGSNSSQQQQQQQAAARKRVVLNLVHQLQLQLLSGGLSAEAAGSVVDDLEVSVLRGLGLNGQLLEDLRAADAQAKLRLAGAAAEPSESEEDAAAAAGGSSSEDGSDSDSDDDDGSAWQDVLLDLLLSLLSNSSSEGGSGSSRGGSVPVPSVPLREACEAVFKAFAEDMTAQGGWQDCSWCAAAWVVYCLTVLPVWFQLVRQCRRSACVALLLEACRHMQAGCRSPNP
jgi:hypothetical protein